MGAPVRRALQSAIDRSRPVRPASDSDAEGGVGILPLCGLVEIRHDASGFP